MQLKRKKDVRAQTELISIIVLILIVMAGVIIIWNVIYFVLKNSTQDISINGMFVDGELEYYLPDNFAIVKIKRGNDNINLTGVKVLFRDLDGAVYSYNSTDVPGILETKRYVISLNQLTPPVGTWTFAKVAAISFLYMFPNNKLSNEVDKQDINKETNMSEKFDEKCLYTDADNDGYGSGTACTMSNVGVNGKSPVSGDCNDANISINPGKAEICNGADDNCNGYKDEGITGCLRNYNLTTATLGSLWVDTPSECNWVNITPLGYPYKLPATSIKFYNDTISKNWICRNGVILPTNSDTAPTCPNTPNTPSTIPGLNGILPYYTLDSPLKNFADVFYCISPTATSLIFNKSTTTNVEVIISSSGEIKYSYKGSSLTSGAVGISYGNSVNYNQTLLYGNTILSDYQLNFI